MSDSFSSRNATDGAPHSKGRASRDAILLTAARLATTRGLVGLSIGDLADAVGMSKSGLYAHFKSKEELELATIEVAASIFQREVLEHAMDAPAGTRRLRALVESFLSHLERKVFPGGCFFAAVAAELAKRPGAARDQVLAVQQNWSMLLKQCIVDAQKNGEVDRHADAQQVVFEVASSLIAANFLFALSSDTEQLSRGRRGVENVLARYAGQSKKKPKAR